MTLSQSSEINLTDNGKRALNAQNTANNAYNLANGAQDLANGAQKTADGKNSVYRGTDPNTVPKTGLKEGDIYFTDNALYTWNGSAWEETVSDTTGAEIHAKVEAVMQASQKADADLRSSIESKAKELDASVESAKTDMIAATNAVASDLSTTKSNLDAVSKDLSATKSNMQSGLDAVNNSLSETKNNLANVSKDLSDTKSSTQSSLDTINKDLSTAKSDLANVSDDLSKTKSNLADTGQKLETAVSDFQKKTDQLSGSLETANSKIEFNSHSISEVKQTADAISTTVSNIRVGGRNLLSNTRTLSDVWTGDTENVDGFTVAKATRVGGDFSDPLWWGNLSVTPSADYVLTFYAKASKQTGIYSYLYDIGADGVYKDGSTYNTLTTDYQYFIVHFHTDAFPAGRKASCLPVRLTEAGVTAWIYGVQLEEGNTATQWTPNPSDTDQAISKVSQTADAIRADLTNTQGDVASVKATASSLQTQITDNKNNISSVKQTADSLTTRMSNAEGNVSSLQQTASGLTSRVGSAEGNISSLQQTASGLQSTVSNIRVGGRNLLSNTRTLSSVWNGDTETVDGFTVAKATQTSGDVYDPLYWNGLTTIKPNTDYVLTFYAKASKQTAIRSYLYDVGAVGAGSDGMTLNTLTTDYQRFTIKFHTYAFPAGRQINCLPVRLSENGVTAWIYGVQLEEGNVATDWTPNPDDTDQAISAIKQTAEEIRADLTNTQGDVASVQATAKSLTSSMADAKGNISQLQQTAGKITTTLSSGGTNLLNNSQGNFQPANSVIDNYQVFRDTSAYMKQGQKYTLSALSGPNGFYFSDSHVTTEESQRILLWLVSSDENINQIISSDTTDSSLGGTHFTWNYPSDTYFLRVNSYDKQNRGYAYHVQIEYGDTATPWQPSNGDISSLQQTASQLTIDMKDAKGNISSFQQTADGLTSRVGSAEGNISQLQQDSKGLTSRVGNAEGNISQLQQTADRIKFSMAGQGLDLVDGLNGELVMGFSIPNTTWDGINACLTLPTTSLQFGEVLPQNAPLTNFYAWEAGKTYTQSIIIETDAQIKTDVQPQWTWYSSATYHNAQSAELIDLGNHCYRLIGSYTPNGNDAKGSLRILDIWNFTSFVNITTGTYLKFRSPHFFCADDNSLSELKITADGINAYVKKAEGSQILSSILSMDPDNSMLGQLVNGKVVAAINLSKEGNVQIDGSHISLNSETRIPDATIKSAMIDSLSANKLTAGTIDASQITVINLDANSITTGSLSARINDLRKFQTYVVSSSSTWNFDDTKFAYGNWFLIGETSTDHVWNGPGITPFMYVTSRGSSDNSSFTVTVWKDNDPTQYQRVWSNGSWSKWVMLPNSQNLVSAINLSPDSVKISGKNIELDGNTRVADGFTLSADKIKAGTLNGVTITGSEFISEVQNQKIFGTTNTWTNYKVTMDSSGMTITGAYNAGTSPTAPVYTNMTAYVFGDRFYQELKTNDWDRVIDINTEGENPSIGLMNSWTGGGTAYTYVGSDGIKSQQISAGNFRLTGHKMYATDNSSLYVANSAGGNFDDTGSVGFQVWNGIGLGQNTIYTQTNDLYVQQGNVGPAFGQSYSSAIKTVIHCQNVISQAANTVSSRLSVKTAITKVDYDRALMAIKNTDMYDYRYTSDDSNQHYVSGIIDDVHDKPEYNMDPMLINKERTARIDANLLGYHHVVLQDILKRLDKLEAKVKQD